MMRICPERIRLSCHQMSMQMDARWMQDGCKMDARWMQDGCKPMHEVVKEKLHRHRPQIEKVGTDGSQRGNQRLPWQGTAGSQTLKLTVPNLGTRGYHCKELPVPRS